jgi:predicted RNA-binding protein YlqC (UPF0109 family)
VSAPKDLDIRGWVEAIARDLVDRPESVEVHLIEEGETDLLEVAVEQSEIGRVIGRQGRTAQALRTLLGVAGARHGRNYELEILD